tara:strand:+ start:241 stop:510 length:270 start_codon:yes stop_codon:yes gene_type:complete
MVIENTKGMTDADFFATLKTDKAETLQHWMGKEDFFFCHWYAESEDAIFDNLEKAGFNSLMMTLPSEMPRFVSVYNITNEEMVDPDKTD